MYGKDRLSRMTSEGEDVKKEDLAIAVVDDDVSLCRALERLLRASGYRDIQRFHSAEDFLSMFYQKAPSLIILDLRLPGMSGVDLLERLRSSGSRIPVILMSSHDEELKRAEGVHYDPVAFLPKPFEEEELISLIHSIGQ